MPRQGEGLFAFFLKLRVIKMEKSGRRVWLLLSMVMLMLNSSVSSSSAELMQPYWAPDHITTCDGVLKLTLDNISGCGLGTSSKYLFGRVTADIKLTEGDSAGVVTAFYMSSQGANHDELDFEFLGNVSGEPYLVQTNVYSNGTGDREQRHTLWFDPTSDFHSYSLLWIRHHIAFLIDGIPIRIFVNKEDNGVAYPNKQAMGVYASIWNADDWATQGGKVKTNWSHAPFISTFRTVTVDACEITPETEDPIGRCTNGNEGQFWWDNPALNGLSSHQSRQLKWVRRRHLVYDYCKDEARFSQLPPECTV